MKQPVVTALVFDTYAKTLTKSGQDIGVDVRTFTRLMLLENADTVDSIERSAAESDILLIHMMGSDLQAEVDSILKRLPERVKVVSMGWNPLAFTYSNVPKEVCLRCYEYLTVNGRENCDGCLRYLERELMGMDVDVPDVVQIPYHGIIDASGKRYGSLEDYIAEHPPKDGQWIGMITSRASWINDNCDIEYGLMRRFEEKGCNVILIYCIPRETNGEKPVSLLFRLGNLHGKSSSADPRKFDLERLAVHRRPLESSGQHVHGRFCQIVSFSGSAVPVQFHADLFSGPADVDIRNEDGNETVPLVLFCHGGGFLPRIWEPESVPFLRIPSDLFFQFLCCCFFSCSAKNGIGGVW